MTIPEPDPAAEPTPIGAAGYVARTLFALVLVGSMVTLFVVLVGESDSGRASIKAYLKDIAGGAEVTTSVGAGEASELTALLRRVQGFSVDNFQSQADTSCFWLDLSVSGKTVPARFVLSGDGTARKVTAASTRRECECPVDFEQPCALK